MGTLLPGLLFVAATGWAAGPPEAGSQPAAPVEVAPSELRSLASRLTLVGNATAERAANLAAETEGPVVTLPVRAGDRVHKGDVLVGLRTVGLELEVKEYQAALASTRELLEEARDELQRTRELERQQVVSERRLVEALHEARALERTSVRLEASLALARDRLTRATLRAPHDGVVTQVHAELGQWVKEGETVVRLLDPRRIEVEVPLPERYAREVRAGDRVKVLVPHAGSEPFEGVVRAVVPEASPRARTFPLLVDVDNSDELIHSGTSARVEVTTGSARSGVVVPKDALVSSPMGTVVFVVQDGAAGMRPVQPGESVGSMVEVGDSVRPGELVVVRGNERLRDGQAVRVLEATP
jgi:RND family efflux transporter MFP subunit